MSQHPGNERRNLVNQHLVEALRGAIAEAEGNIRLSQRLHAQTQLRLIRMSDEDLWELAKQTSCSPRRSVESVYKNYKQRVKELKETTSEWISSLLIEDKSHE